MGSLQDGDLAVPEVINDESVNPPHRVKTSSPPSTEGSSSPQSHGSRRTEKDLDLGLDENTISRVDFQSTVTDEAPPPQLPTRPGNLHLLHPGSSLRRQSRPNLQSSATTGLSLTDIHTQIHLDGSCKKVAVPTESYSSPKSISGFGSIRRYDWRSGSENEDSASVQSYVPTLEAGGDVESLLGEVLGPSQNSPAWKPLSSQVEKPDPFDSVSIEDGTIADFDLEFEEIGGLDSEGNNAGWGQLISPFCAG